MKERGIPTGKPEFGRRIAGRAQDPGVIDTYKLKGKLSEPTVCPQCGAVYHDGRWTWTDRPAEAQEVLCQACQRVNDAYPAGRISLLGAFWPGHKDEILALARNEEAAEKGEHPLNRIMAIAEEDDRLVITTTDIHLPRRIGQALERAFHGKLDLHYDEHAYSIRVDWTRET